MRRRLGPRRIALDPRFGEFAWLAPPVSAAAWILLLALAVGLVTGAENGVAAGLRATLALVILGPFGALSVITLNWALAYVPSALAWHLTFRLAQGRLDDRAALQLAGGCAALLASLILVGWLLFLFCSWMDPLTLAAVLAIVPVSVIASVLVAEDVRRRSQHRLAAP